MILEKGRPVTNEGRQVKEIRVYDFLDQLGISYDRVDHEAAYTIEACDEIDRVLDITICKNLFLCNSQKTSFYMLMMPGHKNFVLRMFQNKLKAQGYRLHQKSIWKSI